MYNPIYPSVVLKIFKDGCQKPFSLFLLTNKYVLSPEASKPVSKKLLIRHGNTLYMQATDPSLLVGGLPETELTYSQYMQAMPCFIELHREFHSDNIAEAWQGHFRNIIDVEFCEASWHIRLRYCIEIHRIVTQRGFRPQNWHQNVYDGLDSANATAQLASHSSALNPSKPNASQAHPSKASSPRAGQHSFWPNLSTLPDNGTKTSRCFSCGRISHIAKDCNCSTLANGNPMIINCTPMARTGLSMENPSATTSTTLGGVPKVAVPANISVPSAAPLTMVTPNLIPDAWESMLRRVGLLDRFGDIPIGLRDGFHIGAAGPVTNTIIYDNHKLDHPLGTVNKPSAPGKFRIVQDFSHPQSTPSMSLNSQINAANFPCEWGFFHNMVKAIYNLPEGSMAATCNVDAAFRQIPIHPND
ncbi:hypothetical protein OPQ81_011097 [Rhizoctonia solani]|nr:hypothetical protein OPQ81_011097 [Rhizoctonia solani]